MVSIFSTSVLDQLAKDKLIAFDFDDYLRVFDEVEIQDELVEENTQTMIIAENAFEAALLKNVFTANEIPSTTDTIITALSTGMLYMKRKF